MSYKLQKDNKEKNIGCTKQEFIKIISGGLIVALITPHIILNINPKIRKNTKENIQQIIYNTKENIAGKQLFMSDERKQDLMNIDYVLNFEFNNFDKKSLENYRNNIKTLKYHYNPKDFRKEIDYGYYIPKYNRIVEIEYNKNTFYHEISHMISTKNIYTSGFLKNSIGKGLNEGYTEFFCDKYFGIYYYNENIDFYIYEQFFAKQLINIIGLDKMNEMYMIANQDMLINELCKLYGTKKDAYEFLKSIDNITQSKANEDKLKYRKKACSKMFKYWYANTLKTTDEYCEFLDESEISSYITTEIKQEFLEDIKNSIKSQITDYENVLGSDLKNILLKENIEISKDNSKYKYSNEKTVNLLHEFMPDEYKNINVTSEDIYKNRGKILVYKYK